MTKSIDAGFGTPRPGVESQNIQFQNASVEDFDDLDGLLNDLSAIKKRGQANAAMSTPAVTSSYTPQATAYKVNGNPTL